MKRIYEQTSELYVTNHNKRALRNGLFERAQSFNPFFSLPFPTQRDLTHNSIPHSLSISPLIIPRIFFPFCLGTVTHLNVIVTAHSPVACKRYFFHSFFSTPAFCVL